MRQRSRLQRPRTCLVLLCAAVGVGLFAAPSASAITSAQCDAQVNDTPSKLVPCIQTDDLWNHMKAFQAIADANPGPLTAIRRATPASRATRRRRTTSPG